MRFKAGGPSGGVSIGVRLTNLGPQSDFPTGHHNGHAAGATNWIWSLLKASFLRVDGESQRWFFGSVNNPEDTQWHKDTGLEPESKAYDYSTDVRKYTSPLGVAIQTGFGNLIQRPELSKAENQVFHTTLKGTASPRSVPLYSWGPMSRVFNYSGLSLTMPEQEINSGGTYYIARYRTNTVSAPPYGYNGSYLFLSNWSNGGSASLPKFSEEFNSLRRKLVGMQDLNSATQWLGEWNSVAPVQVHRIFSPNGHTGVYTGVGVAEVKSSHNKLQWREFISSTMLVVRDHRIELKVVPTANALGVANNYGRNIFDVLVTHECDITWYKRPPIRPAPGNPYYDWVLDQSNGLTANTKTTYSRTFRITAECFLYSKITPAVEVLPSILEDTSLLKGYHESFSGNLGFYRPSCMLAYADAIAKHRATTTNYVETIAEIKELLHMAPDLGPLIRLGMTFLQLRDTPGSIYGATVSRFNKKALRHGVATGVLRVGDFFSSMYLLRLFGWRPAASNAQEITTKLDKLSEAITALQSPQTFNGKFSATVPYGGLTVELTTRCKVRLKGASNDFIMAILQLDAVGLAPSSKNVWALQTGSWLIDIFTGMSTRYDVLDAVALGYMVGVDVCVHSYTMHLNVPETVLSRYGIDNADGTALQIKAYGREVSQFVPAIFGGYDYAAPARSPDKGLVASLLWQLGRSL